MINFTRVMRDCSSCVHLLDKLNKDFGPILKRIGRCELDGRLRSINCQACERFSYDGIPLFEKLPKSWMEWGGR